MPEPIQILVGPGAFALVGAGGSTLIRHEQLDAMLEFLIALKDISEPDADLEEVGAEDSFMEHPSNGPGCLISDPDFAVDDQACDAHQEGY